MGTNLFCIFSFFSAFAGKVYGGSHLLLAVCQAITGTKPAGCKLAEAAAASNFV
jgi:hypothetical protein